MNFLLVGQEVSLVQRRDRYCRGSMRHPGKMLPLLARKLVEEYTRPGHWILDPLSGIGTTGVEATHLGRHYVGLELEGRWFKLQRENLDLARRQGAPGRFEVFQADARLLASSTSGPQADVVEPGRIDAVITSPPYGDRLRSVRTPSRPMQRLIATGKIGRDVIPQTYGDGSENLGNLSDLDYLAEVRKVYAGCYSVLKPNGLLIIVIRPGRDRSRLRPLHHETAYVCTELGFEFLDERVAILARIVAAPGQDPEIFSHSLFFKRLAVAHLREAGHPISLEQLEYVLVFRKPPTRASIRDVGRRHKSGLSTALAGSAAHRGSKEDLVPGFTVPTYPQTTSTRQWPQICCRV